MSVRAVLNLRDNKPMMTKTLHFSSGCDTLIEAFRTCLDVAPTLLAAVERDGRVRAQVIPNSSGPTLRAIVTENVEPGSILYTDEWVGYSTLEREYDRHLADHARAGAGPPGGDRRSP